jgi:hypothetical protein
MSTTALPSAAVTPGTKPGSKPTARPGSKPTPKPTTTRALLRAGVIAGPLFLGTVAAQALAHSDFDARIHPLSSLSLGAHGWIQVANFVVTGLLVLAFAAGLRRTLHPGRAGTWGPILIGANGVAHIVAGLFPTDPINGYPVGAADEVTAHGIIHSTAPGIAGVAGLVAFIVFARYFAQRGQRAWVALCVAAVPVSLALSAAAVVAGDFRVLLVESAMTWGWTTLLAVWLIRTHRDRATAG